MNFRDTKTKGKDEAHTYQLTHNRTLVFNALLHSERGIQHEVPSTLRPRVNITLRNIIPEKGSGGGGIVINAGVRSRRSRSNSSSDENCGHSSGGVGSGGGGGVGGAGCGGNAGESCGQDARGNGMPVGELGVDLKTVVRNLQKLFLSQQVASITGKFPSLAVQNDGGGGGGGGGGAGRGGSGAGFALGKGVLERMIEDAGGRVNNKPAPRNKHKIARDVTILITGEASSAKKVAEAKERGLRIISWRQLCADDGGGIDVGSVGGGCGCSGGGRGGSGCGGGAADDGTAATI